MEGRYTVFSPARLHRKNSIGSSLYKKVLSQSPSNISINAGVNTQKHPLNSTFSTLSSWCSSLSTIDIRRRWGLPSRAARKSISRYDSNQKAYINKRAFSCLQNRGNCAGPGFASKGGDAG